MAQPQQPQETQEFRSTFKVPLTEKDRVQTAIQAKAFELGLSCQLTRLGGVFEQTIGLQVKGRAEKSLKIFQEWLNEELPAMVRPTGLAARVYDIGGRNV